MSNSKEGGNGMQRKLKKEAKMARTKLLISRHRKKIC